jgi:hypothetical protein
MAGWISAQRRLAQDLARVEEVEAVPEPDEDDVYPDGILWTQFHRDDGFVQRTNFTEVELTALFQQAQPFITEARRRGPAPKSSWPDAFLCYLRHDFDYEVGGKNCGMSSNRFEETVARARGVLLRCLRAKWSRSFGCIFAQSPQWCAADAAAGLTLSRMRSPRTAIVLRPRTLFAPLVVRVS